jgi:hypothetical protein
LGRGRWLGTPLGTVRIERGEGPETFERGLQVAPQLERIESLIDGLQRVALRREWTPAAQNR